MGSDGKTPAPGHIVYDGDRNLIVVYLRGTLDGQDVVQNVKVATEKLPFTSYQAHQGYVENAKSTYSAMEKQLLDVIRERTSAKSSPNAKPSNPFFSPSEMAFLRKHTFVFVGHSMGGANALALGLMFKGDPKWSSILERKQVQVVSMGAPSLLTSESALKFEKDPPVVVTRFEHNSDPVPSFHPTVTGFKPVGSLVPMNSKIEGILFNRLLNAHSLRNYVKGDTIKNYWKYYESVPLIGRERAQFVLQHPETWNQIESLVDSASLFNSNRRLLTEKLIDIARINPTVVDSLQIRTDKSGNLLVEQLHESRIKTLAGFDYEMPEQSELLTARKLLAKMPLLGETLQHIGQRQVMNLPATKSVLWGLLHGRQSIDLPTIRAPALRPQMAIR